MNYNRCRTHPQGLFVRAREAIVNPCRKAHALQRVGFAASAPKPVEALRPQAL
jgi:hypothetical protein